jgi:DNA-binding transcriptional LysR family regulator
MELYQLKSFLTIAYEKNLTRAAEALHLSQSALSSQIKLLEEDLGVSLFSRTSRGMAITDQGRILMTHAQDVLETASQLQKRAEEMSRGITATVSIGLNTDPGFLRISATNQRLNRLHNDTNSIFHLSQSEDTPQKLRHGQIDLGFF